MSGHHARNTEPMLESPLCGATVPEAPVGRRRCTAKSAADAWRRAGLPRASKQNENALRNSGFTRQAVEERKQIQALVQQSRQRLKDIE
jgi:hypothetical protein